MFRKISMILVLLALVLAACAPAVAPTPEVIVETVEVTPVPIEEGPEPVELLMWSEFCGQHEDQYSERWNDTYRDGTILEPGDMGERYLIEWHKLHPEYSHVNIKCIIATYGGGRIGQELMAMVRAGEGPNIYTLYGGRAFLAYEIGIDLDKYLSDEDKAEYLNYEQWLAEDGSVYVLPGGGVFEYPVANKQLIERACAQDGFDCAAPEPWSIMPYDEFLEIAEAIKALDDGSYIGVLWGVNPSSQQLNWMWFAQAGLAAFEDGKFTGFPGGDEVLTELFRLYDEGYLYPDVAGITDDDAFPIWGKGKIGIHMAGLRFYSYRDNAVTAGEAEHWDIIPLLGIQFKEGAVPRITGGYFSQAGFIADNTPEEYREAAASFMIYALSTPYAGEGWWLDNIPMFHNQVERKMVVPGTRDEAFAHIAKYGLAESGYRSPVYNLVREALAEMLTSVFLRQATPEEGMAQLRTKIIELQGE